MTGWLNNSLMFLAPLLSVVQQFLSHVERLRTHVTHHSTGQLLKPQTLLGPHTLLLLQHLLLVIIIIFCSALRKCGGG